MIPDTGGRATVDHALASAASQESDLFTVLEAIYVRRFSGAVLVHCANGVPRMVEFPGVQVRLPPRSLDTTERSE